jgi:hypothetical protein
MSLDQVPERLRTLYEIHEWNHAVAVLLGDFPDEWADIVSVLTAFRLKRSYIAVAGGNKSAVSQAIDAAFTARGWKEYSFDTTVIFGR